MQQFIRILLCFVLVLTAIPVSGKPAASNPPSGIIADSAPPADLELYHSQLAKNCRAAIDSRKLELLTSIPADSLFAAYARRGFAVSTDTVSIFHFFETGEGGYLLPEQRRDSIAGWKNAARKFNSPRLDRLLDLLEAFSIRVDEYDRRIEQLERVVRKARRAGDYYLEAFALQDMWFSSYYSEHAERNFARSFTYGKRLAEVLDALDDNYPFKASGYFKLGTGHFQFQDYPRSLALLRKGLSYRGTPAGNNTGGFLRAWNHLAAYHHMLGDLDSAAYYHRTILASVESTRDYPVHAAIAIGNLGRIAMEREEYDTAIAMLFGGLEQLNDGGALDWDFMYGIHLNLGQCYMAKGDMRAARSHLNKVLPGMARFPENTRLNRLKSLYALESKYYNHLGERDKTAAYLDSALVATKAYEQLTGQHIVLLGEQELQQAQLALHRQRIAQQRVTIATIIAMLALLSTALICIIHLYRRRNAAYKLLALKANEWARQERTPIVLAPAIADRNGGNGSSGVKEPATEEEYRIMLSVENEMMNRHTYREPGLTLEGLAERLKVHRNSLSRAINRVTGGNFSQYVNGLRIKEAVRLISGSNHSTLRMEELYEQVGFVSYPTFYRTFKQLTGLSPVEFQKQETSTHGKRQKTHLR